MTMIPAPNQRYSFDYDSTKHYLTVVDVTETHVLYKFPDSRHVYWMTRELWDFNPDNHKFVGMATVEPA
jgi:hypothetical protein